MKPREIPSIAVAEAVTEAVTEAVDAGRQRAVASGVFAVLLGAFLAIAGETVLHNPDISLFGAIVALIGGAIYAAFRVLGAREAKRRAGRADGGGS